jgi:hypothetical protein
LLLRLRLLHVTIPGDCAAALCCLWNDSILLLLLLPCATTPADSVCAGAQPLCWLLSTSSRDNNNLRQLRR